MTRAAGGDAIAAQLILTFEAILSTMHANDRHQLCVKMHSPRVPRAHCTAGYTLKFVKAISTCVSCTQTRIPAAHQHVHKMQQLSLVEWVPATGNVPNVSAQSAPAPGRKQPLLSGRENTQILNAHTNAATQPDSTHRICLNTYDTSATASVTHPGRNQTQPQTIVCQYQVHRCHGRRLNAPEALST